MAKPPWRLYVGKFAAGQIKTGDQRYLIGTETGIKAGDYIAPTLQNADAPAGLGIFTVTNCRPIVITAPHGSFVVDGVTWANELIYQMSQQAGMAGIAPFLETYFAMQTAARKAGAGLHMVTWRYLVKTTIQLSRPNQEPIPAGSYGMRIYTEPNKAKTYKAAGLVMIRFPIAGALPIANTAIQYAPAYEYTWPNIGTNEKENTHE